MKCMKSLMIFLIATNSIYMGSCSKDLELVPDLQEISEKWESKDLGKTAKKKKKSKNREESEEASEDELAQTVGEEEQPQQPPQEQQPSQEQQPQSVEEIQIFPKDHPLNRVISQRPVAENSEAILAHIGFDVGLFADFGSGTWEGEPIGIPFVVVGGDQPKVPITFRSNATDGNYGHESDKGPFPIPLDATVEAKFTSDGHVITIDVDNGMLYELYNAEQSGDGWQASSAAAFDLNSTEMRPAGWTSADAAGLPIFPLLIRYEEVQKGEIDHPIRFVLDRSKIYEGYVHPASHMISGKKEDNLLPMGGRLRLKSDFDISAFSHTNQIILRAMKKYGLILADAGVNMFLKGSPNENWNNADLRELKKVIVSDFEVVELGTITTR